MYWNILQACPSDFQYQFNRYIWCIEIKKQQHIDSEMDKFNRYIWCIEIGILWGDWLLSKCLTDTYDVLK